jgi:uncharacterized protein YutE (UPF0331/DUF86 family)
MVRMDLVREKIRRLRATLDLLARCLPADAAVLADRDALDLVSFRVYLAMHEAVDLASHMIADEGWGPAPSLREHFDILRDRGVIDASLQVALASGVKVRNLIAHGYVEVDRDKLLAAAAALGPLGESYCAAVLTWAESHAAGGR